MLSRNICSTQDTISLLSWGIQTNSDLVNNPYLSLNTDNVWVFTLESYMYAVAVRMLPDISNILTRELSPEKTISVLQDRDVQLKAQKGFSLTIIKSLTGLLLECCDNESKKSYLDKLRFEVTMNNCPDNVIFIEREKDRLEQQFHLHKTKSFLATTTEYQNFTRLTRSALSKYGRVNGILSLLFCLSREQPEMLLNYEWSDTM